jgi:hypothetical protein
MPPPNDDDASNTLLSSDDEHNDPPLSQTATAAFRQLEFFVQESHPTRLTEYLALQNAAKQTNEDPTALSTLIRGWPTTSNEQK